MSDAEMMALARKINAFVDCFTQGYEPANAASSFTALAGFLSGLAASLEARASVNPEVKP